MPTFPVSNVVLLRRPGAPMVALTSAPDVIACQQPFARRDQCWIREHIRRKVERESGRLDIVVGAGGMCLFRCRPHHPVAWRRRHRRSDRGGAAAGAFSVVARRVGNASTISSNIFGIALAHLDPIANVGALPAPSPDYPDVQSKTRTRAPTPCSVAANRVPRLRPGSSASINTTTSRPRKISA